MQDYSPTSPSPPLNVLEELCLKFAGRKTKEEVIKALERTNTLNRLPLKDPVVGVDQAKKDFARERIFLNDVPFIPDDHDDFRSHAFDLTLRKLVDRLCVNGSNFDAGKFESTKVITELVLQRACRTSAGADCFFMIDKLFCIPGTFVTQKTHHTAPPIRLDVCVCECSARSMQQAFEAAEGDDAYDQWYDDDDDDDDEVVPPSPRVGTPASARTGGGGGGAAAAAGGGGGDAAATALSGGSMITSNRSSGVPCMDNINGDAVQTAIKAMTAETRQRYPSDAEDEQPEVYGLCARVSMMNSFAIYDAEAVELLTGDIETDPPAWLEIDAIIVDESNFYYGLHSRSLELILSSPETGKVYRTRNGGRNGVHGSGSFGNGRGSGGFGAFGGGGGGGGAVGASLKVFDGFGRTSFNSSSQNSGKYSNYSGSTSGGERSRSSSSRLSARLIYKELTAWMRPLSRSKGGETQKAKKAMSTNKALVEEASTPGGLASQERAKSMSTDSGNNNSSSSGAGAEVTARKNAQSPAKSSELNSEEQKAPKMAVVAAERHNQGEELVVVTSQSQSGSYSNSRIERNSSISSSNNHSDSKYDYSKDDTNNSRNDDNSNRRAHQRPQSIVLKMPPVPQQNATHGSSSIDVGTGTTVLVRSSVQARGVDGKTSSSSSSSAAAAAATATDDTSEDGEN